MKMITFFSDQITLIPHTATEAAHLGRAVSIREFANGEPVSLYQLDNGELLVRADRSRFMEGPEQ